MMMMMLCERVIIAPVSSTHH